MPIYQFNSAFSSPFSFRFTGPDDTSEKSVLPQSRTDTPGIIRFANKRTRDFLSVDPENSAAAARRNGMVIPLQKPGEFNQASGTVFSTIGSNQIYRQTPRSVLATERRHLDAFGNVIFTP